MLKSCGRKCKNYHKQNTKFSIVKYIYFEDIPDEIEKLGFNIPAPIKTQKVFFLWLSSSFVDFRLYTKNQICIMPGSALTVCVGVWWVVVNS